MNEQEVIKPYFLCGYKYSQLLASATHSVKPQSTLFILFPKEQPEWCLRVLFSLSFWFWPAAVELCKVSMTVQLLVL